MTLCKKYVLKFYTVNTIEGATEIYLFEIYFFQRIYLFTEDLLAVSVFQPNPQKELCRIHLKKRNNFPKNKSW